MLLNIVGGFYRESLYIKEDLIDQGVISCLRQTDFDLINLECPELKNEAASPLVKTNPNIYNTSEIAPLLDQVSIDTVTLANHHIMDFGDEGFQDTLSFCDSNSLKTLG